MSYTSDELVQSVKVRAAIPTSQQTFTTADFLQLADEELDSKVIPLMFALRQEYYVTYEDYAITDPNQERWEMPERGIGNNLRDLIYSPSNPITANSTLWSVDRVEPDQVWTRNVNSTFRDVQFYLQDNFVYLVRRAQITGGTLRMVFHERPNRLIQVSSCAQVTTPGSTVQTVSNIPSSWTAGTVLDLIKGKSPYRPKQRELVIDSIDRDLNTVTLTTDISDDDDNSVATSDYLCPTGFTCIPRVPIEVSPWLAQLVAVKCLEALRDAQGAQLAQAKAAELENSLGRILSPRVRGEPRKIVSTNMFYNWRGGR